MRCDNSLYFVLIISSNVRFVSALLVTGVTVSVKLSLNIVQLF